VTSHSDPVAESDLRAELRALVANIASGVQPTGPGGLPSYWGDLVDAGLPLIGVAEERGGSGGTAADLAVVCYELGRHGLGGPLAYSATAAWALSLGGRASRASLDASVLRTVAAANRDGSGGVTACAPWGRHAAELVLLADDGVYLARDAAVAEPGQDIAGEPADSLTVAPAALTLVGGDALALRVRARLDLLLAASITGAGQGAVTLTKGYVTERRQFDAPLLAIPAVAAGLARMRAALIQSDAALARATEAALAAGEGAAPLAASVSAAEAAQRASAVARVIAAQAATEIARTSHQLHGAIGITAEYSLARFTSRLWAWRDALTSEQEQARELGALVAAGGEAALWQKLTS
jgi:acyl-CoA dehydrogenase